MIEIESLGVWSKVWSSSTVSGEVRRKEGGVGFESNPKPTPTPYDRAVLIRTAKPLTCVRRSIRVAFTTSIDFEHEWVRGGNV